MRMTSPIAFTTPTALTLSLSKGAAHTPPPPFVLSLSKDRSSPGTQPMPHNTTPSLALTLSPSKGAPAHPRPHNQQGFTLTELMVVLFILGLLTTVVLINVLPSQDKAMVTKARADIATLEQAMEMYRLDNLTYPSAADGLEALKTPPASLTDPSRYRSGGYVSRVQQDPWGRPYQLEVPGRDGTPFSIVSLGADGAPGGTDDNADIVGGAN